MVTQAEYRNLPLYRKRLDLGGADFVVGHELESWIQRLDPGTRTPVVHNVNVDIAGASAGETTITLNRDTSPAPDFKLYRNDVVWFPTNTTPTFILIQEDIVITDPGVPVTVAPLLEDIDASVVGTSYAMIPVLSVQDGGAFEGTGTAAIARNKPMGLEAVRIKTDVDYSVNLSGQMYVKDAAAVLMDELFNTHENFYYEARYPVYIEFTDKDATVVTDGSGIGAKGCEMALTSFVPTSTRSEIITISAALEQASSSVAYKPLGKA